MYSSVYHILMFYPYRIRRKEMLSNIILSTKSMKSDIFPSDAHIPFFAVQVIGLSLEY